MGYGVAYCNVRSSALGKKPLLPGKDRHLGSQLWGPLGGPQRAVGPLGKLAQNRSRSCRAEGEDKDRGTGSS